MRELILDATAQVGRPTFFSMLIIIVAHIPIFTLQRHEGRIFAPMAYTVTSALIGSLLFSLTLVPLLCLLSARPGVPHEDNLARRSVCTRLYRRLSDTSAAPAAVRRRQLQHVALSPRCRWCRSSERSFCRS